MSIKYIQPGQAGLSNVMPSWVYIETNDTYATVTTAGYLSGAAHEYVNTFKQNMLAVVSTKSSPGIGVAPIVYILQIHNNNGVWSLSGNTRQTWTPVFTFQTPGDLSVVYTNQVGYYQISGGLLTATFELDFTPTFTTSTGNIMITGLPVTPASNTQINYGTCYTNDVTFPTGCTALTPLNQGNNFILFSAYGSAAATHILTTTAVTTGTDILIQGQITYFL